MIQDDLKSCVNIPSPRAIARSATASAGQFLSEEGERRDPAPPMESEIPEVLEDCHLAHFAPSNSALIVGASLVAISIIPMSDGCSISW